MFDNSKAEAFEVPKTIEQKMATRKFLNFDEFVEWVDRQTKFTYHPKKELMLYAKHLKRNYPTYFAS